MARSISDSPEPDTHAAPKPTIELLQNKETREQMQCVHALRTYGLSSELPLPQVVFCGDQSSGKSNSIKRLTGFRLPTDANMCTRFATEIILSHSNNHSARARIIAAPDRTPEDIHRLEAYSSQMSEDYSEFPKIIQEVTELVLPPQESGSSPKAFARDILSVEISGPRCPDLAIVDLPGLISSSNKNQSSADVKLVSEVVDEYIAKSNTIVLAVVRADNEQACQSITGRVERLGASSRTLGIITRPDRLDKGSKSEKLWIDIAQNNEEVNLGLGWHILRNASESDTEEETQELAAEYFSELLTRYPGLHQDKLGAPALCALVSQLLQDQLRQHIPILKEQVIQQQRKLMREVQSLGDPRDTPFKQADLLLRIANKFETLARESTTGDYNDDFFKVVEDGEPIVGQNVRRLRASENYGNRQFGSQLRRFGSKFHVVDLPEELAQLGYLEEKSYKLDSQYSGVPAERQQMEYADVLSWVQHRMRVFRAGELPTTTNSKVVVNIFKELSEPWGSIAYHHIELLAECIRKFAQYALEEAAPDKSTANTIFRYEVLPKLEYRKDAAHAHLEELLRSKNGHVVTCNNSAIILCQEIQSMVEAQKRAQAINAATSMTSQYDPKTGQRKPQITAALIVNPLPTSQVEADGDVYVAQRGWIEAMATYKNEANFFVDVVARQCIQGRLLEGLDEELFSIEHVRDMDEIKLKKLAGEKPDKARQRKAKLALLDKFNLGVTAFKTAASNL